MALKLGWKPGDKRVSYYWQDPSVDWENTPEEKQKAYFKDGDGSHLALKNGASDPPTKITFRALEGDELSTIEGLCKKPMERKPGETDAEWSERWDREGGTRINGDKLFYWCFRVGVEVDHPEAKRELADFGLICLPERFTNALIAVYGTDITQFFGGLVYRASRLTDDEKKASQ